MSHPLNTHFLSTTPLNTPFQHPFRCAKSVFEFPQLLHPLSTPSQPPFQSFLPSNHFPLSFPILLTPPSNTPSGARKVSLNFLNFYKDPTDPRSFEECTKDAEELILGDPP